MTTAEDAAKRRVREKGVEIFSAVICMTDQLKIEAMARHKRTIFPATVACSKEKTSPPAARKCSGEISSIILR